jgi:hypothetical protein
MTDKEELPSISVQRRRINPDGVTLDESFVQVKHSDIEVCKKIAKEMLGKNKG